jgi:hypothetical protein
MSLHGSLVDSGTLHQSQVSAIFLLLVTIFKAALTASVGTCFAQHLWLILRAKETPISRIEKLFILRTNLLALADHKAILKAPILFLMALFVWCIGIAAIYPPGSITVGSHPHAAMEMMEVSVMNPTPPTGMDLDAYVRLPSLGELWPLYYRPQGRSKNLTLNFG